MNISHNEKFDIAKLNSDNDSFIINKCDTYRDLFSSVVAIFKLLKAGVITPGKIIDHIKTNFDSSRHVLIIAVNTICEGYSSGIFNFNMELEFSRAVHNNLSMTDDELCELVLTKELAHYLREFDPDSMYELLNYVCSSNIRNELVPTIDWIDAPVQ